VSFFGGGPPPSPNFYFGGRLQLCAVALPPFLRFGPFWGVFGPNRVFQPPKNPFSHFGGSKTRSYIGARDLLRGDPYVGSRTPCFACSTFSPVFWRAPERPPTKPGAVEAFWVGHLIFARAGLGLVTFDRQFLAHDPATVCLRWRGQALRWAGREHFKAASATNLDG